MNQWMSELVNSLKYRFPNDQVATVSPCVGLTDSICRAGWEAFGWKAPETKAWYSSKTMESKVLGSFISFLGFGFLSGKVMK